MSLEDYDRLKVIGKGSYGEVWLAKHRADKKQYVLKKMDLRKASKRERLAAEQEAKLLSNLKHPNIVAYKDTFEGGDGYLYIAMGYCERGDLYTRLKEQKGTPLEERHVVEWFVQIAMALQYMHERNILHRDLKTQNIFLTKNKIIKVGDLGIARVLDSSSDMATTLIGTPYYMSPELFSNKPYNFKSDVWALGCCVYEMTTLKHAFNAKDMNALMYRVLRGKLPPMPDMYRKELVDLIKAMLNKNPDKRPSVNRILRDPYIKENIAIFLEGTKTNTNSNRRPGSANKKDRPSSRDGNRPRRPKSEPQSLEPLNTGQDILEPIKEEATPRDSIDVRGSLSDHQKNNSKDSMDVNDNGPMEAKLEKRNSGRDGVGSSSESDSKCRPLPPRPTSSSINPEPSKAIIYKSSRVNQANGDSGRSSSTSSSGYSGREEVGDQLDDRGASESISRASQEMPLPMRSIESSARQRRRLQQQQLQTPRISKSVDVTGCPPELFHGSGPAVTSADSSRQERRFRSVDYDNQHSRSEGEKKPPVNHRDPLESELEKRRIRNSSNGSGSSSEDEEESTSRAEKREEKKEIDSFINLLGTTLRLQKKSKDSDDEGDSGVEAIPETPKPQKPKIVCGATYLMSAPSPLPPGVKYPYVDENSVPISARNRRVRQRIPDESPHLDVPDRAVDPLDSAISMTTTGRLFDRISVLRKDCIHALGVEKLKIAYDILDCFDTDELEPQLVKLLGVQDFEAYAGKIFSAEVLRRICFQSTIIEIMEQT